MKRILLYGVYATGALAVAAAWWQATGSGTPGTASGIAISIGRITGLLGTYAVLWQLVLMSRLPIFDQSIGLEHLTRVHKLNGYVALSLLAGHLVFLIYGYAAAEGVSLIQQFINFELQWEDVLKGTLGFALLVAVVGLSVYVVRRRMRYEAWYAVHLTTYGAVLLAWGHQLPNGGDFGGRPLNRLIWTGLFVLVFGLIGFFRFTRPVWLLWRHRFQVDRVVPEADGIVSVYITGRRLEQLHYLAGQFFIWRFLDAERWWQAHPFTVSQAPNGRELRITVKALGDFTHNLVGLKPGTWVSLDGPHGYLIPGRITGAAVTMIAGGIGITPIRALLEALPPRVTTGVIIYAARRHADLALRAEVEALAKQRGFAVHFVLSEAAAASRQAGRLDTAKLKQLAPGLATSEVIICGPPAMMDNITQAARAAGVPPQHIYLERFAYDR